MNTLSEKTKRSLEANIGLSYAQIISLDDEEQTAYVESKTGVPLSFSKQYDPRKIGRGNPLLARRRIKTLDDINSRIDSLL